MKGTGYEFKQEGLPQRIEMAARAWAKEVGKYGEVLGQPCLQTLQDTYEQFIWSLKQVEEMQMDPKNIPPSMPSSFLSLKELVDQLKPLLKEELQTTVIQPRIVDAVVELAKAATSFLTQERTKTSQYTAESLEVPAKFRPVVSMNKPTIYTEFDSESKRWIRLVLDIFYKGSDCRRATNDLKSAMYSLKEHLDGTTENRQVAAQKAPAQSKSTTKLGKR